MADGVISLLVILVGGLAPVVANGEENVVEVDTRQTFMHRYVQMRDQPLHILIRFDLLQQIISEEVRILPHQVTQELVKLPPVHIPCSLIIVLLPRLHEKIDI
jgi:hypothetical protein